MTDTGKVATVADLFRRAQALRSENPQASYKEVAAQLVREFSGGPFPPTHNLTIPEQDARAPEEDWTAGLPLVLRGIQQQDWKGIAHYAFARANRKLRKPKGTRRHARQMARSYARRSQRDRKRHRQVDARGTIEAGRA